jgi:hypothetical protein
MKLLTPDLATLSTLGIALSIPPKDLVGAMLNAEKQVEYAEALSNEFRKEMGGMVLNFLGNIISNGKPKETGDTE